MIRAISPSDIFFINTHTDINMIRDCNIINGSLFINGDYNIHWLEKWLDSRFH